VAEHHTQHVDIHGKCISGCIEGDMKFWHFVDSSPLEVYSPNVFRSLRTSMGHQRNLPLPMKPSIPTDIELATGGHVSLGAKAGCLPTKHLLASTPSLFLPGLRAQKGRKWKPLWPACRYWPLCSLYSSGSLENDCCGLVVIST
jgi:hypothetical protein